MASVDLVGVTKSYGDVTVFKELDLSIPDGEFLTIAGPSGCGKTTLLLLVAGLEAVTGGDVLLDGQSVADLPGRLPQGRHGVSGLRPLLPSHGRGQDHLPSRDAEG